MQTSRGRLPSLFALAIILFGTTSLAEPFSDAEAGANPYETSATVPATELSEPELRRLLQIYNRYNTAMNFSSAGEAAAAITGATLIALQPFLGFGAEPNLKLYALAVVPFLAFASTRPLFAFGREATRGALLAGQSEDPEIFRRRDEFFRVTDLDSFWTSKSDPSKGGLCARVARATFSPTETLFLALGSGVTAFTVSSFRKEITETWEKIKTELGNYAN